MKVLVTGGAGFIGSHIVDLLLKKNYEVVIVDNLSTGHNINKKAKFYEADITDINLIHIFETEKPDFVIHEAAQINVRNSLNRPIFDAQVNILGSINVLECCKNTGVKKIVYASSGGAVYGEPLKIPCTEEHSINPLSPYGISKHAVEHYLYQYKKNFGLDYIILRYSNVYGPRQDPKGEAGVVSIFIDNLMKNETPVINGDGKQTRDFVFVEDVAEANLLAVKKSTKSKIFNIGTGSETSVNQIFEKLKKISNSKINAKHGPEIKGEVRRISLDCGLAKKELGWVPKTSIDEGLKRTYGHFSKKK